MARHTPSRLLAALPLLAIAGAAAGQNALGDGRALDNSLQTGTRYNAPGFDYRRSIEFSNAVVTGNAPGGRSFRGGVGYRDRYEFRGNLGSDDIFEFQRDALYSGLPAQGISSNERLAYERAVITGGRPQQDLVGDLTVPRDRPTIRNPWNIGDAQAQTGLRRPFVTERPFQPGPRELRAPSAYTAENPLIESMIGEMPALTDDEQSYGVTGSALRGLRTRLLVAPNTGNPQQEGAPPGARDPSGQAPSARTPGTSTSALDTRFLTPEQRRQEAQAAENAAPTQGTNARIETSYLSIRENLRRVREERGARRAEQEETSQFLRTLRERLRGSEEGVPGDPADPAADAQPGDPTNPIDPSTTDAEDAPTGADAAAERLNRFREEGEILREAGRQTGPIRSYDSVDTARIYRRQLERGQELLAEGRYIDAESRFASAVAIRPDDAIARAGLAHAQLGAALFLSAGRNLADLFISNPEMIGVRFDPSLLPPPERIEHVQGLLRDNVGLGERGEEAQRLVSQSALLLAYTGWLQNEEEATREGLQALRETDPRLTELLSAVWLQSTGAPQGE